MLIRDTAVLSLGDLSFREHTDVLIQGNRVLRLGSNLDTSADTIEGSGCYLIPGLVNLHSHTAMTLLRGVAEDVTVEDWFNSHIWLYEKNLTPYDVYVGTLLGAAEMLLSGVTWVADHYFHMDQAAQAYMDAGMRADLAWAVFGVGDGWEARYEEALDFTRAFKDHDPRISVSLGPHSPYLCPDHFLKTVATLAGELGLDMHIHASEEEAQVSRTLQERDMTPIEVLDRTGVLRERTILAHAYYATDKDLRLIRDSGAYIAHCPKTYMRFGDVNDLLPRALRNGAHVGLGTDGAASNSTLSIFEAARDAALLAKCAARDSTVARIGEVFPMLFAGGEALGADGYGSIEEGALADLVLIRAGTPGMHPAHNLLANMLYSLDDRCVDTVLVDGRVVVRGGRLVNIDLDGLYREAAACAERLTRSICGAPLQVY